MSQRPLASASWCSGYPAGKWGNNLALCRAYVEELEERVKRMDEQLQMLSRGAKSSQRNIEDSQAPGSTADINRPSRVYKPELLTEGNISSTAQSPGDEASSSDQEISDQSSYVLRAQDGKMRFFGWFFYLLSLGHGLIRKYRGVFWIQYTLFSRK